MPDVLWLPIAIIAAFAIAGIVVGLFRRSSPESARTTSATSTPIDLPYRKRPYLFSRAERSFYEVLRRSIPTDYVLFTKVRLIDILMVPASSESRYAHQNKILSKQIDFLLCTASTISPALVIELDDSSHERQDRAARDDFLDASLAAAGLPILHIRARQAYDPRELSGQITATLSLSSSSQRN